MQADTATRTASLEVILRETLADIERSERHFEDLAKGVDTTTGEGKRLQQRYLGRRQDYATQGDGLRMVLGRWERENGARA